VAARRASADASATSATMRAMRSDRLAPISERDSRSRNRRGPNVIPCLLLGCSAPARRRLRALSARFRNALERSTKFAATSTQTSLGALFHRGDRTRTCNLRLWSHAFEALFGAVTHGYVS